MSPPLRCPHCGAMNRAGARFCTNCRGAFAAPLAPTPKTCPRCQQPNRMDARFCAHCGHVFIAPAPQPFSAIWARLQTRVRGIPVWLVLAVASGAVLLVLLIALLAFTRLTNIAKKNETPTLVAIVPIATPTTSTAVPTRDATTMPSPPTFIPTPAPGLTETPVPPFDANAARERALRATVMVIVPVEGSNRSISGSGSVITQRGYILTNNHLFYDENGNPFNAQFEALIAFPSRADLKSNAQIQYRAVLVENDTQNDLALIRITARRNGSALPTSLDLATIPVGNSDAVAHGDILTILGYPGIGGDSLTLTSGNVSGFLESEGWIKTDAEINQGNSGGPALNSNYELIGIASAASQADKLDLVGKLGLVRPIKFALGLIQRAKSESGE